MTSDNLLIRKIEQADDLPLSRVIKGTLEELDAAIDGTVYTDKATDHMSFQYQDATSVYYVAILDGNLVGGSGIKKVPGDGFEDVCELQRMFLHNSARGKGIGNTLISLCLKFAAEVGFKQCYLETLPQMNAAIGLYKKHGFRNIDQPMGATGHFSCDVWMLKDL